jgi:hypothetical protein
LRSFFCASSFCRKRKRGDRVAWPDWPCLVIPKPFWPPCIIRSLTKAVRLISHPESRHRVKLHAVRRTTVSRERITLIVKRREVETDSLREQNAAVRRACYPTCRSRCEASGVRVRGALLTPAAAILCVQVEPAQLGKRGDAFRLRQQRHSSPHT